jgi:serine/threonine protein kinase/GTPase SAR1 family protein
MSAVRGRRKTLTDENKLHRFARRGRCDKVKAFIAEYKDDMERHLSRRVGVYGYTPLHEASVNGRDEVLRLLLQERGDPNVKSNTGYTPLHSAASGGHVECVRALLKSGADITLKDDFERTPLETAQLCKHYEVMKLIRTRQILDLAKVAKDKLTELSKVLYQVAPDDVEPQCFNDALQICVKQDSLEAAGKLLLKGATDWSQFITYSLQHQQYQMASLLYLCKAAQDGDTAYIKELFKPPNEEMKQKTDQQWHIKQVLCWGDLQCVAHVPIKLGMRKENFSAVYQLLLNTDCSVKEGRADWRGLALRTIDPQWLMSMGPWVKKLSLMSNYLTSVPKEFGKLGVLERLNLAHNRLTLIPSEIVLLPLLKSLTLANNDLVELPDETEWTPSLNVLNISHNQLKDLPKNIQTASLRQLRIAANPMSKLPLTVSLCDGLQSLDISDTKITFLPNEVGRLTNLVELNTEHLDITDPNPSLVKAPRDCVRYLRQRLRGSEPYFKMKMMIVGYANRGKSTLVARLQGVDIGNLSTVGIDLREWSYSPSVLGKPKFTFQIWDFGGQVEYYATHQCFLSQRSLYVVVWRVTDGEDGIKELKMWLDNIAVRAPKSPVIIVGTFLDKLSKEQRQSKYDEQLANKVIEMVRQTGRYAQLEIRAVVNVSCAKESRENIDFLKSTIYDVAAEFEIDKMKVMGMHVPASYLALERQLNKHRLRLQQKRSPPIKWKHELRSIVQRSKATADIYDVDELDLAVRFLHEIGSVLHFDDASGKLSNLYFIDPRWLCDMMAVVVTVREKNPYVLNGILQMSALPHLFKGKQFPSALFPEYVLLLNRFEIALPLDRHHVLIPSMLPEIPPANVPRITPSTLVLRRQHSMAYIPPGFWSRLIARLLMFVKEISQSLPVPVSSDGEMSGLSRDSNSVSLDSISDEAGYGTFEISLPDQSLDTHTVKSYSALNTSWATQRTVDDSLLSVSSAGRSLTSSIKKQIEDCTSLESNVNFKTQRSQDSATVTNSLSTLEGSISEFESSELDGPGLESFDIPDIPAEDDGWELVFEEHHFDEDKEGSSPQIHRSKTQTALGENTIDSRHNSQRQQMVSDMITRLSFDQFANLKKYRLSYWRTGFCFNHPHLFFMLRQYDRDTYKRSGIETMTSTGPNGCRTLSRLADEINKLIEEWFPGLFGDDGQLKFVSQLCPCTECYQQGIETPHVFPFEPHLVQAVLSGSTETIKCKNHGTPVKLLELVPDLLLADLDSQFVLSPDEIICSENDEDKLGAGAFGTVFLGYCRGQQVAIKTYFDSSGSDPLKPLSELRQEVAVLQRVNHPNLVGMVGVCQKPLRLVLDLAPLGSLDTYLKKKQLFARVLIHRMAGQVAAALAYLHNELIIFRDLKAANVLVWSLCLSDAINVKLTDYGIATFAAPTGLKGFEGTKGFQAPEMLKFSGTEEYTCMVDIYAFAMFLYQLIAQRPPFHTLGEVHISPAVLKGRRPALRDVPVSRCGLFYLTYLMKQCWSEDPLSRVPAANIAALVHNTEVQCTLGVINISESAALVQHACLVDNTHQLWIATASGSDFLLYVYELPNLVDPLKTLTFSNAKCSLVISNDSMVFVAAVLAPVQEFLVYQYQSLEKSEPKLLDTIQENEFITSLLPLGDQLVVGTQSGSVHVHQFPEKNRKPHSLDPVEVPVGNYPITALIYAHGRLWCASKRYIYVLEDQDWSLDGLWTHCNIENPIASLQLSVDGLCVWCNYVDSPFLTCWKSARKGEHVKDIDLQRFTDDMQSDVSSMAISQFSLILDTIWIACQSGHLLVVSSKSNDLIYVIHPYHGNIGFLLSSTNCCPCRTEKGIVVSCGQSWKPFNEVMLPRNLIGMKDNSTVILWEAMTTEDFSSVVQLEKLTRSRTASSAQFKDNKGGYWATNEWAGSSNIK